MRRYTVKRYVVEVFDVEFEADETPTREDIIDAAENPHTITVVRETVRPLKEKG